MNFAHEPPEASNFDSAKAVISYLLSQLAFWISYWHIVYHIAFPGSTINLFVGGAKGLFFRRFALRATGDLGKCFFENCLGMIGRVASFC